jgi:phytoene dehydrogenase-like protein
MLGLIRHGLVLIEPSVRVFAPQPEGPAITLWSDVRKTASGLRERSAADAQAYPMFDKKVRSLSSFVAHLTAATPPDVKSPTFADAIVGLKLGKAFMDSA